MRNSAGDITPEKEVKQAADCEKYSAAVELALSVTGAPMAFVVLHSAHGNYFFSGKNTPPDDEPASNFAQPIISSGNDLVVEDASADDNFMQNAWVISPPYIKGFAGVPVFCSSGTVIGCLCVAYTKPHKFTKAEITTLTHICRLLDPPVAVTEDHPNNIYHSYVDSLKDVIFILGADKKIITFNKLAEQYIQSDHGKKVKTGDEITDYIPEELIGHFDEHFDVVVKGGKIDEETSIHSIYNGLWWRIAYDRIEKNGKLLAIALTIKNVTRSKRTERLLAQISDVSKVGGWETDFTNKINTWSPVALAIHEIPEDFELNLENSINFYKEGKSREMVRKAVDDAIAYGTPFDLEVEFVTYTGRHLWIHIIGDAEHRDGKIHRMFGTFQDITEKKTLYEELLVSQQYYKSLFEHNADAVFALDLNEKFISVNASAARLAETTVDNMVGKGFAPYCPAEDCENVMYYFNEAQRGHSVNYDCGFITAQGNRREVNITNLPIIINGTVVAIYGIAKDISEQIAARNQVLQSEANLKTVFENTEIGYILLTDDFRIISFNKPAQDYTLSKGQSALSENDYLVTSYDDERGRSLREISIRVLAGEKVEYERNIIDTAAGDDHWYNIIFHPVYGDGQRILGIIMEIENITARKKNALELEKSMGLLNEQNKRLLNFSYITSHNLRSHTSNIKSIISFLEDAETEDEKKEMMEHLKTVSNSLDETIHNLNDVVSINNSVNLIYRPLFLIEFVSKATDILKEQIILKQAIIENKLMIDASVNYNPAFLESIMLNFLSNALKYSDPERIPVIILDSYMDNGQFVLTIADNGIGIDLEKNGDKLFGFYKTFNGNTDARGLGLFICKNQVEYMGGKIEVESELGKGTTFKIYFK